MRAEGHLLPCAERARVNIPQLRPTPVTREAGPRLAPPGSMPPVARFARLFG